MTNWVVLPDIKDADFARPDFRQWFTQLVQEVNEKNRQQESEYRQMWLGLLETAKKLYGVASNEARYIQRASYPSMSAVASNKEKSVLKRYDAWVDAQERKARKAQRGAAKAEQRQREYEAEQERLAAQRLKAHDYRNRREAAIEALAARGFVPGISFDPGQAISFLKEVERDGNERNVELEVEYRGYEG